VAIAGIATVEEHARVIALRLGHPWTAPVCVVIAMASLKWRSASSYRPIVAARTPRLRETAPMQASGALTGAPLGWSGCGVKVMGGRPKTSARP
jgi:hypothetical protein